MGPTNFIPYIIATKKMNPDPINIYGSATQLWFVGVRYFDGHSTTLIVNSRTVILDRNPNLDPDL